MDGSHQIWDAAVAATADGLAGEQPKKVSTWFIQLAEVGVKCSWMRGGRPASRGLWGACGSRSCLAPRAAPGVGRCGRPVEEGENLAVAVAVKARLRLLLQLRHQREAL